LFFFFFLFFFFLGVGSALTGIEALESVMLQDCEL
jgi:hypothetical protein